MESEKQSHRKLGTCIKRIDKYLEEDESSWEDVFDEFVNYHEETAEKKASTTDDIEAQTDARQDLVKLLPDIKEFISSEGYTYKANAFAIQIFYNDSGPWHGNIVVQGVNKANQEIYITLNHWHKGIGLIDIGEIGKRPFFGEKGSDIRCQGRVRQGLTLSDVIIYGLKWWASVDRVFARKYYSKQLWPASCHGLADTIAYHIAEDYNKCLSVSEWSKKYKNKFIKHGFSSRKSPSRKSPTRKSPMRKSPMRKSPMRKSPTRKSPMRKSRRRKSPMRKSPRRKSRRSKSRRRKSPMRKSPMRKSPRRKSRRRKSRRRKSRRRKSPMRKSRRSKSRRRKSRRRKSPMRK
jgi:hypothetical protein